jgi:hypothetical protein
MIRPLAFGYNAETAKNNVFQHKPADDSVLSVSDQALKEFDAFVHLLEYEGIQVTVIQDSLQPAKPDAVFPNNWISFHQDGTVITYPMYSKLRREERREDIIQRLSGSFDIKHRIHFEEFEQHNQFLEGTGSMVLDRIDKIAYACISERTDLDLLNDWCSKMNYIPHTFHGVSNGQPIYHTNVMMAIASKVAVVCLDCLPDQDERNALSDTLSFHHHVVEISDSQVQSFAGNMLALKNKFGEELMVMSARALDSLSNQQRADIEKYCRIVASPIPTIEDVGGGSARCMIAEVFLDPR